MLIGAQSLKTCITQSQISWIFVQSICFIFCFSFIGFSDAPTPFIVHLRLLLSVETCENLHHRKPPWMQGSACVVVMTTLHGRVLSLRRHARGSVPSKGTITSTSDPLKSTFFIFKATLISQVEPQIFLLGFPFMWVHLRAFRAALVTVWIQLRVLRDQCQFEYQFGSPLATLVFLFFYLLLIESSVFSFQGFRQSSFLELTHSFNLLSFYA